MAASTGSTTTSRITTTTGTTVAGATTGTTGTTVTTVTTGTTGTTGTTATIATTATTAITGTGVRTGTTGITKRTRKTGWGCPFPEPPLALLPRPHPINPRRTAWVRAAPPSGGVVCLWGSLPESPGGARF